MARLRGHREVWMNRIAQPYARNARCEGAPARRRWNYVGGAVELAQSRSVCRKPALRGSPWETASHARTSSTERFRVDALSQSSLPARHWGVECGGSLEDPRAALGWRTADAGVCLGRAAVYAPPLVVRLRPFDRALPVRIIASHHSVSFPLISRILHALIDHRQSDPSRFRRDYGPDTAIAYAC